MAYLGKTPNIITHKKLDDLTFNGVTTSFSLTSGGTPVVPGLTESVLVVLNGAVQEPNVAYTISGSSINFAVAHANTVKFFGIVYGERLDVANALPLTGGTLTGTLTLNGNATNALHAVPKQQLDSSIATAINGMVTLTGTQSLSNKTINGGIIDSADIRNNLISVSTNTTATAGAIHILADGGIYTFTLPAAPVDRQWVGIVNKNTTNVISVSRNGKTINGIAEDLSLDTGYHHLIILMYQSSANDWVIM